MNSLHRVSFDAFPIETAPKDKLVLLWCPMRGLWRKGRWNDQSTYSRPVPYWTTYEGFVSDDRCDQPTLWAEVDAPRPLPVAEGDVQ